jgi:hypothetical protein
MADTSKLSVGKALEKLRGTDAPKSRMTRLDEQISALDEETRRLRAQRRQLERGQRGSSSSTQTESVRTDAPTRAVLVALLVVAVIFAASLSLYFWVN